MKRKVLLAAFLLAAFGVAGSCTFDEREVHTIFPLLGDAGVPVGTGSSTTPQLSVTPAAVDLGWVATGFAARTSVRIANTGGTPLPALTAGFAAGTAPDFEIIQNQCTADLPPGEHCDLRVQLIPSRVGPLTAALHIASSSGLGADISLTAEGLAKGDLILAPAPGSFEDFGGVALGATVQGIFTVSNPSSTASEPLEFRANRPEFSVLPPDGTAGECVPRVTSLVSGEACTLRVAFAPSERGPVEATLTSRSSGAGSVSATLTGRGLAPGALVAGTASIDFGGVVLTESTERSVRFVNEGDEPLTLAGASLAPPDAEGFAILVSDCGAGRVLAGSESCGMQVEFRPPRVDTEMTAELWADAVEGQQHQVVALRGIGLAQGALTVEPVTAGEADFGSVLSGGGLVHLFEVSNPGAQPSGVLILSASDGFEIVGPPGPDECNDATSIVDGQSCTVRVRFSPTRREAYRGALTVTSALAGAKSVPLLGQGIVPAQMQVDPEINFGRVFTSASTERTLTVTNAGDEPLGLPSLELTAPDALAAAFSYENRCTAPLAFGETCEIVVRFSPSQAIPHSANLRLVSMPGGTATVLLLAEVLAPGSLVLDAAPGSASDFGDVPIGASATRNFSLTNPGNVASGRLTIRTDNNRFEVLEGDCNPADSPGLVDGSNCTFSVRFTPSDSLAVVANLSVQSLGAGQKGLEIRGRGRSAARLDATASRDLGRAHIGQEALTQPENQFVWTVTNTGDLASGTLSVANDNPSEFVISNDSCTMAAVPGSGSCSMTIRFHPGSAGARTARIVVLDGSNGRTTAIALTAIGERLAQLGQSCANAVCSAGTCTRGVCCDRDCSGTCQVCSAAGVCADQSGQEQCGNGNGRCFGVNRCLLPNGQACGQGGDCGNGNCEPRLNGQGTSDRICCQRDCDAIGQQCNAQGQCQQPTLAAGATCGGPSDAPCGAGLECKSCRGGGNRCTPANECCGGCAAGYSCIDGDRCGCPTGQIDCGGGLCIQSRDNACCPATAPRCSGARPNCDGSDHTCKECLNAAQCAGSNRACNAGVCACAAGTRDCGGGRCIGSNQCCETCTGGRSCQNGNCACPNGQTFVNGQCVLPQGAACTVNGTPCVTGQCVDGVCCESTCQGLCAQCQSGTGRCVAPADDGNCQRFNCDTGDPCQLGNPIDSNRCVGVGQCKTAASCTSRPAPVRTPCGPSQDIACASGSCEIARVCDGNRNCISPTVACNGVPNQPVAASACCDVPMPRGEVLANEVYTTQCEIGGSGHLTTFCDSQNDCPTGTSCCAQDFGNFNSMACSSSCAESANPGDPTGTGTYLLCSSPGGGTTACPGGRACNRKHPELIGWTFCALP